MVIHDVVAQILQDAGVTGTISFSIPPKQDMGDLAFGCFEFAKQQGKNPVEVATELAAAIEVGGLIERVETAGPYINIYLNGSVVADLVFGAVSGDFGSHTEGKGKRIVVEYACPNPMKVFHLGHLRNLITGEATVRMFENAGYEVKRVNYQGDVGMHIAKSLWGLSHMKEEFEAAKNGTVDEQVTFLGKAYAYGATQFEEDDAAKAEILDFNRKVYEMDSEIVDMYKTARGWSLEYFDTIYAKLGSRFDRLYFESEVFESGKQLVEDGLKKGIFKESEGAIIFEGSKHGLHDRVFINSQGFPTYEAKDMGLGQMHFNDYDPDQVIHVVGKEQREYFQVVFKALSELFPETEGKEYHLVGGYLQLKGDTKMSSRKGNVISGDQLIRLVEERVRDIMKDAQLDDKEQIARAVAVAALKYSMLKVGASQDMAFDMEESISTSGDSGPYLLYIVARIKSILSKVGDVATGAVPDTIDQTEKQLLLKLAAYPDATHAAVQTYDPSQIAKYVFSLAQDFNKFYAACSVMEAEGDEKAFRVELIKQVEQVMTHGLYLLGINTVERM